MSLGARPSRCTALRIAARSTINGTPVKSCSTMRATTNGISAFAGDFAFHFASASTSLRRTFSPSQLRSTDSRTIRMLTGKREMLLIPCSSSAGREKKSPSRPLPASNVFKVLNSSFSISHTKSIKDTTALQVDCEPVSVVALVRSFQFTQLLFNLLEIGQLPRVIVAFGVLDHATLIDNEGRTF